jgi:KAT8 regulatory NSL complex subunit 2
MIRTKVPQQTVRKARQPVEGLFCNYSHRTCMHNRLEGFEYCVKHILEDKTGPYKLCGYISLKNGKRCINAAPQSEKRTG